MNIEINTKGGTFTFMAACRDFFGLHPGETSLQFGAEVKALTQSDREEITLGLQQNGYTIRPSNLT